MGEGLKRLCKHYGSIRIQGQLFVWDYAADEAVDHKLMPNGSERWKASELARAELLRRIAAPAVEATSAGMTKQQFDLSQTENAQ
jgi:hypothetical protein